MAWAGYGNVVTAKAVRENKPTTDVRQPRGDATTPRRRSDQNSGFAYATHMGTKCLSQGGGCFSLNWRALENIHKLPPISNQVLPLLPIKRWLRFPLSPAVWISTAPTMNVSPPLTHLFCVVELRITHTTSPKSCHIVWLTTNSGVLRPLEERNFWWDSPICANS